ncbi:cell division protein FtsQ/DivIB [Streptomyces sp. WMMC897]|uniref:cell division protein FtsQ/DivIB n=1 Tax=Streptomyces sp. WMMC897 TaxID=3014782 RepID=UPI0022B6925D|nr:FtsQ-type POTRA domain-containing protein [Streptomyces sp. WMMC897]MCZ7413773.1 FtsQ-type POTRA domain-containing protein [Streptomyces sp. WMMC897]
MGGAAGPVTAEDTRGEGGEQAGSGEEPAAPRRPRLPRWPRRLRPPRLPSGLSRRTALLLAAAATAAVAGFGVWVLYGSSWLRAEHVRVAGTRELTPDRVRAAAGVPLGEPLAGVDTGAIERRIEEALGRVAEAKAVRDWPDGITLELTERTPRLVVAKPGEEGTYVEIDAEGVRYAEVRERPAGVPLLVFDLDGSRSDAFFGPGRLRAEAVRVAVALPKAVREDTRTVRVRSFDSVTLELTGDRTVLWGSGEDGAAKAKVLTALMKAEKDAEHYNVSVPSAPAASGG